MQFDELRGEKCQAGKLGLVLGHLLEVKDEVVTLHSPIVSQYHHHVFNLGDGSYERGGGFSDAVSMWPDFLRTQPAVQDLIPRIGHCGNVGGCDGFTPSPSDYLQSTKYTLRSTSALIFCRSRIHRCAVTLISTNTWSSLQTLLHLAMFLAGRISKMRNLSSGGRAAVENPAL